MTRRLDAFDAIGQQGAKSAERAREREFTSEEARPSPLELPDLEPAVRPERPEAFSSRMTPTKQGVLKDYVYAVKRKGYGINQYDLLDVLVGLLEDPEFEPEIRRRLLRR